MNVLHLLDSPRHGGATRAAQSVFESRFDNWIQKQDPPSRLQSAIRTVGGYCDRSVSKWLRARLQDSIHPRPDVIHLHNFKEWGTGLIHAAKSEGIPVVWSCYDYWCLHPHDIEISTFQWWKYQPVKGRKYPLVAKLPLIGRAKRIRKWMNQLDAIICLSGNSENNLRIHGYTAPIHRVPLPITVPGDLADWDEVAPNRVMFLGGLAPHKGRQVFMGAMKHVQGQIPGAYPYEIPHPMERRGILKEITESEMLVVPEQWANPGPCVIVEAALLGTPVVAACIGGIPEMGLADHYSWTPSFADLAQSIIKRLELGRDREIIMRGVEARKRHDPVAVNQQLDAVYKGVLK